MQKIYGIVKEKTVNGVLRGRITQPKLYWSKETAENEMRRLFLESVKKERLDEKERQRKNHHYDVESEDYIIHHKKIDVVTNQGEHIIHYRMTKKRSDENIVVIWNISKYSVE